MNQLLAIHPEVASALSEKKPIVALESTVIAHGLPQPDNVNVALEMESIVRANGATPATIAVMGGHICVGLTKEQINQLATQTDVKKLSRQDLPYAVSQKQTGATTVAATMAICQMAGIRIFATGGIGGVHRFFEQAMDVSADLGEFTRSDVAVICAGAKSILDIGKTLELLESLRVPIIGFKTNRFPAFYSQDSGFELHQRLESPKEVATYLAAKRSLGFSGGVVIANPIPAEAEIDAKMVDSWIDRALGKAKGISGKRVTPFLLSELAKLSEGKSVKANIALLKNNALIAAQIAAEFIR